MSIITILMFLAIAASVCLVIHVVKRDKVPLWVAVALLCMQNTAHADRWDASE